MCTRHSTGPGVTVAPKPCNTWAWFLLFPQLQGGKEEGREGGRKEILPSPHLETKPPPKELSNGTRKFHFQEQAVKDLVQFKAQLKPHLLLQAFSNFPSDVLLPVTWWLTPFNAYLPAQWSPLWDTMLALLNPPLYGSQVPGDRDHVPKIPLSRGRGGGDDIRILPLAAIKTLSK